MALQYCPMCRHQISPQAAACPSCGHPLRSGGEQTVRYEIAPQWNRGIAAVLSFFIPGAGQIYKGQVIGGFAWLIAVTVGYVMLWIPGAILHFFCVLTAATGDPHKE